MNMANRFHLTRRSFLSLLPVAAIAPANMNATVSKVETHHFQYDYVIGTSMDLVIWSHDSRAARHAEAACFAEIQRLAAILNTRDGTSEICRIGESTTAPRSHDLRRVFAAYDYWKRQTNGLLSIRPGPGSQRNVDALGKAYIIDRAAGAVRTAVPEINGLLLNIGGDIVSWGRSQEIDLADPSSPEDNATPLGMVIVRNAAVATSGTYARGAHLLDARTGRPAPPGVSATVIARDALTANALATTLCVTDTEAGFHLVESTPGAEALRISPNGLQRRTSGFAAMERPRVTRVAMTADWPAGFELTIALVVKPGESDLDDGPGGGRTLPRPYIAVWVENSDGKLVHVLAFWSNKPEYYREMSTFYRAMGRNQNLMYSVARATRPPGSYLLIWDGLDDQRMPLPLGTYKIVVEADQEHGDYSRQGGTISCAELPATLTLPGTSNFEPVVIKYGPRQNRA